MGKRNKKCPRCNAKMRPSTGDRIYNCEGCLTTICTYCDHPTGELVSACGVCYLVEMLSIPFSLTCHHCDDETCPVSPKQALAAGWKDLTPDLYGAAWNFLGDCPLYNPETDECED